MADSKISNLPSGNLIPSTIFPILDNGITSKTTFGGLTTALAPYFSGGTSNSTGFIDITKPDIDILIANNTLIVGATYKISGFYKNKTQTYSSFPMADILYDDGTNAGTTIFIQALSTNTLSTQGIGEFYNPKYYDISTYYDKVDGSKTAPNGLYGIWDGDNPLINNIPTYSATQVTFWGGYAWRNLTGNVGTAVDICKLNIQDWVKLKYSDSTWYNKVYDFIEIDYPRDYVVTRRNGENDVVVTFPASPFMWNAAYTDFHAISVMAWGLYSRIADWNNGTNDSLDSDIGGIFSVSVVNAYCETVNFKGSNMSNCKIDSYTGVYGNYFGQNTYFTECEFSNYSRVRGNKGISFDMTGNKMSNGRCNYNVTSQTGSSFQLRNNVIHNSRVEYNVITDGNTRMSISDNNLSDGSQISNNTASNIYISIIKNKLNSSLITYNTLSSSASIEANILNYSSVIQSNIINGSYINNNTLNDGSNIRLFGLTSTNIRFNTLTRTSITNGSMVITDMNLQNNMFEYVNINNFSNGTIFYSEYYKTVYKRPDGINKIRYYNNSDILVISDITD